MTPGSNLVGLLLIPTTLDIIGRAEAHKQWQILANFYSNCADSVKKQSASVLVVSRGIGAGSSYLLTGDIVVAGRAPDADLFLDDVTVSRRHAEFRREPHGWVLRDTESLNGTYVNRSRVDSRPLVPGDEVQIGKYRFVYLVGGE